MSSSAKPSYTFKYFNVIGLAEASRLLLCAANVDWVEENPEWPQEKANQPFGRLPVLIEKSADGSPDFVLSESGTIERYLARKYSLIPSDPKQESRQEQLRDQMADITVTYLAARQGNADSKSKFDELTAKLKEVLAKALKENGSNGHFLGEKLTYIDLCIYSFFKFFMVTTEKYAPEYTSVFIDLITPDVAKVISAGSRIAFKPALAKSARQVRKTLSATTPNPSKRVKLENLSGSMPRSTKMPSTSGSSKFKCTDGVDGNRLLTFDDYVVSFTNSFIDEEESNLVKAATAGGFKSARSMISSAKSSKGRNKAQPATDDRPEHKDSAMAESEVDAAKASAIVLDEAQERISKLDIEKPLLIVAGAGSGKTSTLCARVLEIIRHGIYPMQILVITFTNKAADELKSRIARYMQGNIRLNLITNLGDGRVMLPHTSTFHSWCYGLVSQHYTKFGWKRLPMVAAAESEHEAVMQVAVDQINDSRRLVQCEQMLNIAPPEHKQGSHKEDPEQSLYIHDAQTRWKAVIAAAIEETRFSIEDAAKEIEAENEDTKKGGRKGKLSKKTKETTERNNIMKAAYKHIYAIRGRDMEMIDLEENPIDFGKAFPGKSMIKAMLNFVYRAKSRGDSPEVYPQLERSVLEAYNKTLERFGLVDFDDLLLRANDLLEMPDVLQEVQQQFPYLLVDEFQDLNQLQMNLVLRLQKNIGRVTAVGDERQSIYAFRGASCEHNFKTFLDWFVDAQVEKSSATPSAGSMECLTRNYRSHQSIVDLGNIVAKDTIGDSELLSRLRVPLTALPSAPAAPVSVWSAPDISAEAETIARMVRKLLDKKMCKASDIAIISRCLDFGMYRPTGKIEIELLRNGIPYIIRGSNSALKLKRMQTFMALIRVVVNPNDDIAFDTCLEELVMDIGPVGKRKIRDMNSEMVDPGSLYHKARCILRTSKLPINGRAGLLAFVGDILRWRVEMRSMTLTQLLKVMFKEYIENHGEEEKAAQQGKSDEGTDRLWEIVLAILDSLKTSSQALTKAMMQIVTDEGDDLDEDLYTMVVNNDHDHLCTEELLSEFLAQLCMLSTAAEDKGKISNPKGTNDQDQTQGAVVITTVHQAKGLEWDHVFIPHFNENLFPMGFRGAPSADLAKARMDPVMEQEIASAYKQHFREEGRLAYVAITRAKNGLYISVLEQYPQFWMKKFFGSDCCQSRYLPGIMYAGKTKRTKREW
ncbi:hypothetical protein GGI25_004647 [Coemansia spiralis]|uniref:DNA 3'-5' helicase n=1 Tax=Coemansia spiralis TaxID=417178 RepID=A0A9W8G007_9FUNG|nr:hypothetical protein GGI25_004647 [Coemansia spiralis]